MRRPIRATRYANAGGVSTGTNWSPGRGTNNPYPTVSFSGSDDPLLPSDVLTYNTTSAANGWGPALQFPTMIGAVGIGYNPAAAGTWNENGAAPTGPIGAFNLVSLQTDTWCGIFTGAINDWNDAEITADNGGTSLTGGVSKTITVVYRSDGSGTTFLMANCVDQSVRRPPLIRSRRLGRPRPRGTTSMSGQSQQQLVHQRAERSRHRPAGHFVGASGNGGIKAAVLAQAGRIGYSTTDFVED